MIIIISHLQITEYCSGDDGGCLTEVIDQWMKGLSGPPTWRELADNLNNIGEKELADQLMSIYQTGENCIKSHVCMQ